MSAREADSAMGETSWQAILEEELDKTSQRKHRRWLVVFIIAIIVLVGSLAALRVIAFSYIQGQQKYDDIAEKAEFDGTGLTDTALLDNVKVNWDALLDANPDTVAWVYVPGTNINYPVVQGEDNDHYLYYDFDGNAGWLAEYGTIFLDYQNKRDFTDPVSFIYGHHMNDGSMFASLSTLEDQQAFDEHRIVYLLTPHGNFRLRSFSIVHCDPYDPIVETTFDSKKKMTEYIQNKIDRSSVDASDIPAADDMGQVFAFATCDAYSAGRDVLFTYILDTSAVGLEGRVGISGNDKYTWFVDELREQE